MIHIMQAIEPFVTDICHKLKNNGLAKSKVGRAALTSGLFTFVYKDTQPVSNVNCCIVC